MADDIIGLTELLKINDQGLADINVTDILDAVPVLLALAATRASNGTNHRYLKETTAPVVGFRAVNTARVNDHSEDTLVSADLTILDASFYCDKALAKGFRKGVEAFVAREAKRHLCAAFFAFEKQVLLGTVGGDASGFDGLADAFDDSDDAMVVDAGGTTESTASSLWAIRTGGEMTDVCLVGGDESINAGDTFSIDMGETVEQFLGDTTNGGFTALYTSILAWLGLQVGSAYSVGRICNLTADVGKGLTDELIAQLLAEFPAARPPTLLAMNRRSRLQLQQSRTAVNATGAAAPFPTEAFGVPIITTDAIGSTETLLTDA